MGGWAVPNPFRPNIIVVTQVIARSEQPTQAVKFTSYAYPKGEYRYGLAPHREASNCKGVGTWFVPCPAQAKLHVLALSVDWEQMPEWQIDVALSVSQAQLTGIFAELLDFPGCF